MLNPATDSLELEVYIITDESIGALEQKNTEFKHQCHELVSFMLDEAYNSIKNFTSRVKVKLVHHLKSLGSSALRHFANPSLRTKNRSSRSRRSHSASRASSRSADSSDSDSSPSDPLPLQSPPLNLSWFFSLFSMSHTSINEVTK